MAEGFVFLVFYIHISIQWEDTEVNWNPLKPDEVAFIAASIKYDKLQCKAGELYSQIATLDCLLENKVYSSTLGMERIAQSGIQLYYFSN